MKHTASASGNPSSPLRMTHRLNHTASASGKIILSGEYAVVFGYPGIAIPAPFTTTATFNEQRACLPDRQATSNFSVTHHGIENEDYLHQVLDAIIAITGPPHGHLTLKNTIPVGRGLGSSTALVIALCRCLFRSLDTLPPCVTLSDFSKKNRIEEQGGSTRDDTLKKISLSIEDTVNPGHSGLDFEVIWEGKPLLFQKGKPPKCTDVPVHQYTCMSTLIDTGKPNETTPEMVEWLKERACWSPIRGSRRRVMVRCSGAERRSLEPSRRSHLKVTQQATLAALQTIAHCTERLLVGESPFTVFPDHHRAQVALGVVPKSVQTLIADIEESGGTAKVVGAGGRTGGGGMVLAIHQNKKVVEQLAKEHGFPILPLSPLKLSC